MRRYIYVMQDGYTGYCKIGWSVSPRSRETTLGPQIPMLRLLWAWPTDSKLHERRLHDMFKDKHIRGEWFDLDSNDLLLIFVYFDEALLDKCIQLYRETHPITERILSTEKVRFSQLPERQRWA